MKKVSVIVASIAMLLLGACSTPKDINYFQDASAGSEFNTIQPTTIRVRPNDKLLINVSTPDERLSRQFNLINPQVGSGGNRQQLGYFVDNDGTIDFPILGPITVAGMTREEVANYITKELTSQELLRNCVVTVEFANLGVTVLGEVNRPGFYPIEKDNFTILEALGEAGDLTIFGERENVKVIRYENGFQKTYEVNLCDADNVYNSTAYYLKQNDVIYVDANNTRARQSTVSGNTLLTPGFWISIGSLALSIVSVLIIK